MYSINPLIVLGIVAVFGALSYLFITTKPSMSINYKEERDINTLQKRVTELLARLRTVTEEKDMVVNRCLKLETENRELRERISSFEQRGGYR